MLGKNLLALACIGRDISPSLRAAVAVHVAGQPEIGQLYPTEMPSLRARRKGIAPAIAGSGNSTGG
jgi:hypothetical protein